MVESIFIIKIFMYYNTIKLFANFEKISPVVSATDTT